MRNYELVVGFIYCEFTNKSNYGVIDNYATGQISTESKITIDTINVIYKYIWNLKWNSISILIPKNANSSLIELQIT